MTACIYVTEIKEKQIFERIRWQLRIFESVFYKSRIRACSFGNSLAASQNARSDGQTSNHRHCEFVKNALKKCSCLHLDSFKYLFFFYFCHIYLKSIQIITQCVCFTVWVFIINICLLLKNLKNDNVQHTILNFIRECLQVFIKT